MRPSREPGTSYRPKGLRKTIDQKLYRIIEEKKHISNAVLGAEDNIQTNIVDMMARIFDETEEEE